MLENKELGQVTQLHRGNTEGEFSLPSVKRQTSRSVCKLPADREVSHNSSTPDSSRLLHQSVGDVAARGLTRSYDLHYLTTLYSEVPGHRIPGLYPRELVLSQLISGQ